MKLFKHLVLCLLLFWSCDGKRYNSGYSAILREFKKEYVSHFPLKIKKGKVYWNKHYDYDVRYIFLTQDLAREDFHLKYNRFKTQAIGHYFSNDSCLLVVNMFTNEWNYIKNSKATEKEINILKKACLAEKKPVPNFWPLQRNATTGCNLPENYEIFVLEAKKGKYWEDKYLTDGRYMPEYWKHGYSRGVAMNKESREIVYWFVIW